MGISFSVLSKSSTSPQAFPIYLEDGSVHPVLRLKRKLSLSSTSVFNHKASPAGRINLEAYLSLPAPLHVTAQAPALLGLHCRSNLPAGLVVSTQAPWNSSPKHHQSTASKAEN